MGFHSSSPEGNNALGSSRETRTIRRFRCGFLVLLLASTGGISLVAQRIMRQSERDVFVERFDELADKIFQAMGKSIDETLGDIDTFAFDVESYARFSNSTWPFVTLPEFAERAAKFIKLTDVFFLGIYHLVTEENREAWEEYTVNNNGWMFEVEALQQLKNPEVLETWDVIHDISDILSGNNVNGTSKPGPYLVSWQNFPVTSNSPYNFNGFEATLGDAFRWSLTNKSVVFSRPYVPRYDDLIINLTYAWFDRILPEDDYAFEPVSTIFYPVENEIGDGNSTGVISAFFYWKDILSGILPLGTGSVDVVFKTCSETFTYQVMGPDTEYRGSGDLHDFGFEALGTVENFVQLGKDSSGRVISGYDGIAIDPTFCETFVKIYPTASLEDVYITRTPTMFSVTITVVFLSAIAVFVLYDCCVERRQRKVLVAAMQSALNEVELEAKVKERTLQLKSMNDQLKKANAEIVRTSEAQLQHFACMSHEIRTPLNCIIGCSSLMADWSLDADQQDSIEMVNASSNLLLAVVNDVLDYSKLESGNVDIDLDRTSLQRALDLVLTSMTARAESEGKQIVVHYDIDVPAYIHTDIRRFQQILYNLLGNAVKFSKAGGIVELNLSTCDDAVITGESVYTPPNEENEESDPSLSSDSWLRISIKDYGKGIDPKNFERVFKAFSQDNEDKENIYGGSGLGLSITTKLVHRMSGSIFVTSQPGEGSEFSFFLPETGDTGKDVSLACTRLRSVDVVLLSNQAKEVDRLESIFSKHDIDFSKIENLTAMSEGHRKKLLIVQEDLFDAAIWEMLPIESREASMLLSFGKRRSVEAARAHYRTFQRLLAPVLLVSLSTHLGDPRWNGVLQRSSSRSQATQSSASICLVQIPYKTMRVLIAEDNVVNQKILRRLLIRLGVQEIEIVDNGQRAVEMEASRQFDYVLMDMQMPVLDGVAACEQIHSRDEEGSHPRAKVIFVTAHALTDYKEKCYRAGGIEFVPKPCSVSSIDQCFQRLAEKSDEVSRESSRNGATL